MVAGDDWIGRVVSAIENGPDWDSTAIFITYDDCGCFYDHVPPPMNPDGKRQGIRLPMVIVSPYAKADYTDSHDATLASVLAFTEDTFGLPALSVNDAAAYDYSGSFRYNRPPRPPVRLHQTPVPPASIAWANKHPDENDAT
jgi:phospholipase C